MARQKSLNLWQPSGKRQKFEAEYFVRSRVEGERTLFNLQALGREYKLGQAYRSVRNLEYRADRRLTAQNFKDYLTQYGDIFAPAFNFIEQPRPPYPPDESYRNTNKWYLYPKGKLLVLVDSTIYNDVKVSIDQYVLDVGRDGYWAMVYTATGGTPKQVRTFIKNKNPVGALLVGAIPVPWFDLHGDQFPCDLYYMDQDGTWTDPNNDGRFEGHNGNVNPEIWIGRLWTPKSNGGDVGLINDYFARNHKFRLGQLGHARSALAYVDDDWTGFDDCAFDEMLPSSVITKYTDPMTTDADLYKAEVNTLRSWVQLCAHSWVQGHALRVGSSNEYIDVPYFRDTNPPNAHFYNLFCCGPGKFTVADYLGGWYIFDKDGSGTNLGLTAVASGKSGSMLFFEDFYRPMGLGKVIGDAYVDWWKARGPDHDEGEIYWHYGLALLGDPTLNWWKGAVPQLVHPQPEDTFDHWPRKLQFRWEPVDVPGVVRYSIEIDAYGAVNSGKWAEATGQSFLIQHNLVGTKFDHTFVGMQRGRWRVRATVGGQVCSWTPWRYFKFTI